MADKRGGWEWGCWYDDCDEDVRFYVVRRGIMSPSYSSCEHHLAGAVLNLRASRGYNSVEVRSSPPSWWHSIHQHELRSARPVPPVTRTTEGE